MEPTIYKPSIYKGAGVYNGGGGIYKPSIYNGAGVYNGGGGGDIRECVFLTYFKNFNDTTKQDVPQIGDPYTILLKNTPQVYEKRIIPDLYGGVTALYNYSTNQDDYNSAIIKNLDLSNNEVFSLELWFLNEGTRSDYQVYITLLQLLIFDPGFDDSKFRISGPYANNNQKPNYTLFNGTAWSSYSSNYIQIGEPTRFVNTFVSLVADRNKNEIRLYANGKIMYKVANFNIPNQVYFKCNNQSKGKQTYITGLAAFTYDKSKNEGMTYSVPQKKYS